MNDEKAIFDKTTALEITPGATHDAPTELDVHPPTGEMPSILKELAPESQEPVRVPSGAGSRQLVDNYRAILAERAI